jgi:Mycothiol maleylpyruvate isomerase N-terminal domain
VDRRLELILAEDERWAALCGLIEGVPAERLLEAGVTPEWSVKDLLAHIGSWMAEAACVLERIRLGTYQSRSLHVDEMNRQFYDAWKDQALPIVWAELESARTRMYQEWGALQQITPEAEEWFVESGPDHFDEHLPALRAFLSG